MSLQEEGSKRGLDSVVEEENANCEKKRIASLDLPRRRKTHNGRGETQIERGGNICSDWQTVYLMTRAKGPVGP